jgi:hypothetical protein
MLVGDCQRRDETWSVAIDSSMTLWLSMTDGDVISA